MTEKNVLQISDFNVDFWVDGVWYPAVIDMNLGLAAGKVTAIVGESGSGKSTTALGLMSLLASNASFGVLGYSCFMLSCMVFDFNSYQRLFCVHTLYHLFSFLHEMTTSNK